MFPLRPVFRAIGPLMCGFAVVMLVPAIADLAVGNPDWKSFVEAAGITGFIGGAIAAASISDKPFDLTLRQGFVLTCLAWLIISIFAALPLWTYGLTLTDAVFEAVSGITTTGSTVMIGLDTLPPGILLWRSLLQWVGGVGIVVMAIIMLPFLRIGGMQLFRAESSDQSDSVVAGSSRLVMWIFGIYAGLTALCAIAYSIGGMSGFDAFNHAMTTLSTGGFSTHDASFGYFDSAFLQWSCVVFMAAGGLPFVAYIRFVQGDVKGLTRDPQVRGLLKFFAATIIGLALWREATAGVDIDVALIEAAFNVVSVVTTTGFATTDYTLWAPFASAFFLTITFVGGCTGSTSGGIKIYRFQMAWMLVRRQLVRLFSPLEVSSMTYGHRRVGEEVPAAVFAFIAVFGGVVALGTIVLTMAGLDLVTALSATATAIANVGPGLGPIVGPAGNFEPLPDVAKWLLAFVMILGRLEIFTLLVLLDPRFWRR